jgi:hypothetical protein
MTRKSTYISMGAGLVAFWAVKIFFPTIDTGFVGIMGLAIIIVFVMLAIAIKLLPLYVRKVRRDYRRRL